MNTQKTDQSQKRRLLPLQRAFEQDQTNNLKATKQTLHPEARIFLSSLFLSSLLETLNDFQIFYEIYSQLYQTIPDLERRDTIRRYRRCSVKPNLLGGAVIILVCFKILGNSSDRTTSFHAFSRTFSNQRKSSG